MSLIETPYATLARDTWRARLALRHRPHGDNAAVPPEIAVRAIINIGADERLPPVLRRICIAEAKRLAPLSLAHHRP